MRRHIDPVVVQARDAIETRLEREGFKLQYEHLYHDAAFGSATFEYRHRARWLRLQWDGKDRYLWLIGAVSRDQHTFPAPDAWHPLDTGAERFADVNGLQPGPKADTRIAQLLDQVELFLASAAAV